VTPPQDVNKQPAITGPNVSQRPAPQTPDISKRPELPTPVVSKGTPESRLAVEGIQRPKTPSVTFGGYRGASEARGQSLRGQSSRQSSEQARPPAAPTVQRSAPAVQRNVPEVRRSAPEGKDSPRGEAPADKRDAGDKKRR